MAEKDAGGNTVTKDEEKAEALPALFASVNNGKARSMGTQLLRQGWGAEGKPQSKWKCSGSCYRTWTPSSPWGRWDPPPTVVVGASEFSPSPLPSSFTAAVLARFGL